MVRTFAIKTQLLERCELSCSLLYLVFRFIKFKYLFGTFMKTITICISVSYFIFG